MRQLIYLVLILCSACSVDHSTKNLTSETAVPLIQAQINSQNNGLFELNYSEVAGLVAQSGYTDYRIGSYPEFSPAGRLQRLLLVGMASVSTQEEHYPDLSGTYDNPAELGFHPLVLSMQPASLGVGGRFRLLYYKNQNGTYSDCTGTVKGMMNGAGIVSLRFITTSAYYCNSAIYDGPFRIQQEGFDIILSSTGAQSGWAQSQPACSLHTKSNVHLIAITSYSYVFSKEFQEKAVAGKRLLNVGKIEATKVGQILLAGTDTLAEGTFNWRAKVNKPGEAYLGMREVDGQGRALFRKQPDGAWVCANANVTYPYQLRIQ
jgi:hypothetical protein